LRAVLFLALAPLLFAAPASAETTFTIPDTVTFDGKEAIEQDIAARLQGTIANGMLTVEPNDPAGGQKVAYTRSGGPVVVSADVGGTFGPRPDDDSLLSGPGVVIGHNDDTQSYYLFILTRDGYAVRSVVNGSFAQALSGSLPDGVAAGAVVRLSALDKGKDGAEFFINGQSVGAIADSGVDGTGAGLIHLGSGKFTFDNFVIRVDGKVPAGGPESANVQADNPPSPPSPTSQVETPAPPRTAPPPPAPPPLPSPPQAQYFIGENGKPVGPLNIAELGARIGKGTFTAATLVWKEGMADWQPANTLPELKLLFEMAKP